MKDCVFCKIVSKESPASIVYEDDISIAFKDINPQAPIHILVIPKRHIRTIAETTEEDKPLLGHLIHVARKIAEQLNISKKGFRLVANCGLESGQSVWHIHLHLLGGRKMKWPPG
ncbi:MAG TPA: histidine triad nucleotide-binding protein [Thermodesulfobacteriota bacterium]|jgi:histidine triad (HIT) family protein|nr:histidine triad nucleotide-binding protein [Thermodesulfobacteriota bacterium]